MKQLLTVLILISMFSTFAYAQTYKNEFGFKSDNDSYLAQGSDRYYTNGLFIYFRHAMDQEKLNPKLEKKTYEISVGQEMYNPISGYTPDPTRQDRPFAGYLYGGAALNWFYSNERILKVSAKLGTTGPNSLAEDGQELLHDVVGFYALDGWQYQIKNALTINFSGQYTRLLHRAENNATDFSFEGYANLGTIFNGAGAGILFRAGGLNQLFNSAYTNAVIGNNAKTKALVKREVFFYYAGGNIMEFRIMEFMAAHDTASGHHGAALFYRHFPVSERLSLFERRAFHGKTPHILRVLLFRSFMERPRYISPPHSA